MSILLRAILGLSSGWQAALAGAASADDTPRRLTIGRSLLARLGVLPP